MKENLIEAAIREVQEETNIQTKFESLVSGKRCFKGFRKSVILNVEYFFCKFKFRKTAKFLKIFHSVSFKFIIKNVA